MKLDKYIIPLVLIGLFVSSVAFGVSVFKSNQIGTTPINGSVLQTNGNISTWVATSTLGIIGGSGSPGTPVNSIQFNSASSFGGSANLLFTGSNAVFLNGTLNATTSKVSNASTTVATNGTLFVTGQTTLATTSTTPLTVTGAFYATGSTTLSSLVAGMVQSTSGGALFSTPQTGTGLNVLQTSPTLITPILGVASGTSLSLSTDLYVTGQATLANASSTGLTVTTLYVTGVPTLSGVSNCNGTSFLQITSGLFGCAIPAGSGGGWATSPPNFITTTYPNITGTSVGINTSTPIAQLTVVGIAGTTTPIFVVASSTGDTYFQVKSATTTNAYGKVVINPQNPGDVVNSAALEIDSIIGGNSDFLFKLIGSGNPSFKFANAAGTPTAVTNITGSNGLLSSVDAYTWVPTSNWVRSTRIIYAIDGTLSTSSAPSQIQLFTTPTGSVTTTLRVVVNNQGYVGIGSSTPTSQLVVQGTAGQTVPILTVSTSSNTSYLTVASNGSTTLSSLAAAGCVGSTATGLLYVTTCGSGGVSGGTNGYAAIFTSATTLSTGDLIDNLTVSGVNATSSTVNFTIKGTGVLDPFNVTSSSGTTILKVKSSGNVGVGTASPTAPLQVNGVEGGNGSSLNLLLGSETASAAKDVRIDSNAGALRMMASPNVLAAQPDAASFQLWGNNSSLPGQAYFDSGSDNSASLNFRTAPASSNLVNRMIITSGGNIGIASTVPNFVLSVNGTVAFSALSAFATGDSAVCQRTGGQITVDSGLSSCIVSSQYVKENIHSRDWQDAEKDISLLNVVLFDYKDSKKPDMGLLAEQVAVINPLYAQYTQVERDMDGHHYKIGDPVGINWSAITADLILVTQHKSSNHNSGVQYLGLLGLLSLIPLVKKIN